MTGHTLHRGFVLLKARPCELLVFLVKLLRLVPACCIGPANVISQPMRVSR